MGNSSIEHATSEHGTRPIRSRAERAPESPSGAAVHCGDRIASYRHDGAQVTRPVPNLFVIGAMKSGTTYLAAQLSGHPQILICAPEEPSYFVDPEVLREIWPHMWKREFWRSEDSYLRLFEHAGGAAVIGEASTNYTKLPQIAGVVDRIKRFNPEARFVYLMRDPVDRAITHYWHMVRHHSEHRSLDVAIEQDLQYRDVSYYAMQLRPYLEAFGRDRVHLLTHETLTARPREVLRELYAWLGVDPSFVPPAADRPVNVTPRVIMRPKGWGVLQRFRKSDAWARIADLVPASVRSVAAGLAEAPVDRTTVSTARATEFLRPIQRRQTEELMQLVGREFPEWKTLWGTGREGRVRNAS